MRSSKTALHFVIITAVCLALFLPGLLNRGLWSPDETRYIVVAKDMADSGDWIILRRNGEIYTQKPPVFFWVISLLSMLLGGFSEFSARLPSAAAGAAGVLLTYQLGKRLFGEEAALASSLILATSIAYLGSSQWVILDPLLTSFVLAAIYLLYLGIENERKRTAAYIAAFVFMALASLTKGPVGFILPLLVMTAYAAWTKKARTLLSRGSLYGLIIFLIIIASWLIPACIRGGEAYTRELLGKQIFGRYFEAFDHKEPFYFYLYAFPLGFLPWVIFLPAALVVLLRNKADNGVKLVIAWLTAILLFFTLSKSKNFLYVLPAYPAAAMAVAYYWKSKGKRIKAIFSAALFIAAVNACLFFFIIPQIDELKSPKYLSAEITKYIGRDKKITTFKMNPVYWLYYCGRDRMEDIEEDAKLYEYLLSKERVFCIVELGNLREFMGSHRQARGFLLAYAPYGSNKTIGLISNRIR